jgi:formate dehydrogenase maturation protein FdhE
MSLVTTPTSTLATCGYCGSARVTSIFMTLTDGTPVDFASCHTCERRSWSAAGDQLPLTSVLDRARKLR